MKTNLLDIRHVDCMDLMAEFPDNHFDLAVVDPPYGIGEGGAKSESRNNSGNRFKIKSNYVPKNWDKASPDSKYFTELFRVSKNQIIWGANHFMEKLCQGSPSWIVWDKENGDSDFADAELAFTSHKSAVRIFRFRWAGMLQGSMKNKETRIHPTQKPVKLYEWVFANYAEKGMRVLDTHLGSGSIAIAAHYAGIHLTASELDSDYYTAACQRIEHETAQKDFFQEGVLSIA
jgi:site-specific DNA-methyltransferase (adenine-specific)